MLRLHNALGQLPPGASIFSGTITQDDCTQSGGSFFSGYCCLPNVDDTGTTWGCRPTGDSTSLQQANQVGRAPAAALPQQQYYPQQQYPVQPGQIPPGAQSSLYRPGQPGLPGQPYQASTIPSSFSASSISPITILLLGGAALAVVMGTKAKP